MSETARPTQIFLDLLEELRRLGENLYGQQLFPRSVGRTVIFLATVAPEDLSVTRYQQIEEGLSYVTRHFSQLEERADRMQRPNGMAALAALDRANQLMEATRLLPITMLASSLQDVRNSVPIDADDDLFYQVRRFGQYMGDVDVMPQSLRHLVADFVRIDPRALDSERFEALARKADQVQREMEEFQPQPINPGLGAPFSSYQRALDLIASINGLIAGIRRGDYGPPHKAIEMARLGSLSRSATSSGPHGRISTQHPAKRAVVFIAHGHSPLWRELKDYVANDLNLEPLFFESRSHVGEHMAEILEGFLEEADCAITLLTRDDEQEDGRERARQNVVHETGYFQGTLGFKRVAMVIQREVEEFSNVAGIVPIHFEGRHIDRAFPDISRWLKREGLLP